MAKLRQLVETLRQSVRARDDFIAIAAHELRNPMTPIVGVAELALIAARKDGKCPPRVILLLERLQRLVAAAGPGAFCQSRAVEVVARPFLAPHVQYLCLLDRHR